MDVGLKLTEEEEFQLTQSMFQSLFWWMLVLNSSYHQYDREKSNVSILVLVDVGLKLNSLLVRF